MKCLFLALFLAMSLGASAQKEFERSIDTENGSVVISGQFDVTELQRESTFKWFSEGVENYKPDAETIGLLKEELKNYNLVILLGTWCEDSHILIPKLIKTLLVAEYPMKQLQLIGVDRAKEAKSGTHKFYNSDRIPTIILFKDGKEVGRIVEVVKQSVENDLHKIVSEQ